MTLSISGGTWARRSSNRRGPPTFTVFPLTTALAPLPGRASNPAADSIFKLRFFPAATIAFAIGCSESASTLAATASTSSSLVPGAAAIPDSAGAPFVSVPVLSKITMFKLRARSSASRSLTSKPFFAAFARSRSNRVRIRLLVGREFYTRFEVANCLSVWLPCAGL
jgi:hypothetical protein